MRRFLILPALVFCSAALVGSARSAPSGATALCRDGTYSYSQHHSGTCSHHGGVAKWLDGNGKHSGGSNGNVAVGHTVLLGRRVRSADCSLGALPDRSCSPGAYYSKLTRATLCASNFRTGSIRNVSDSDRHAIEIEYGLAPRSYGRSLEIDHIVPLELGGSNNRANLFPEPAHPSRGPGYQLKDKLENAAHHLVCAGKIPLRTAQRSIAGNWERFYKQVFGRQPTR
jgi:hypothetical protein